MPFSLQSGKRVDALCEGEFRTEGRSERQSDAPMASRGNDAAAAHEEIRGECSSSAEVPVVGENGDSSGSVFSNLVERISAAAGIWTG